LVRERIALWSLHLTPEATSEPRAAVIYGKARWIGPLMKGREIAAGNLARLFAIVGADCECGMDLAWTRGTVLPVRWTASVHQTATKSLGFDPLDPLVQIEAARILERFASGSRGGSRRNGGPAGSPPNGSNFVAPPASTIPPSAALAVPLNPVSPQAASGPSWRTTWVAVLSLVCLVAAGSIWLRRRERR
jgi:hypothetical protein